MTDRQTRASTTDTRTHVSQPSTTPDFTSELPLQIHFENIMGGGDMEDFVNGVLSSLGPDILQALEDVYEPWLEEALRKEINDILHGRWGWGWGRRWVGEGSRWI